MPDFPWDSLTDARSRAAQHPDGVVDLSIGTPVDDTPDKWKDFYNANVEFFSDLGSPGGAAKTGKIGKDHPLVAALPPQGEGH